MSSVHGWRMKEFRILLLIDFKILGAEIKILSQGKSGYRFLNYLWLSGLGTEVSNLRLEEFKEWPSATTICRKEQNGWSR